MNWNEAKAVIKERIIEGTDLNTKRSSLRKVIRMNHRCVKYDYNGEEGFLVRISNYDMNNLEIPWSLLEKCFHSLKEPEGYNGKVFRHYYPRQAQIHPCHVHVVGIIFKKAGTATSDPKEKNYYPVK
jgi:hypothetical protein